MKTDEQSPIVIEDLHKSFGEQKVLNGIDLVVHGGETLAVLGRSGTGKSVLLKLIVGLQKPDSGSIRVLGQDIARLDGDRLNEIRKKIGFLFQSAALYDSLSIEENVAFPLARHTRMSEAERKTPGARAAVGGWDGERFGKAAFGNFRWDAKARWTGPRLGAGSRNPAVRRTDGRLGSDHRGGDREAYRRRAKEAQYHVGGGHS